MHTPTTIQVKRVPDLEGPENEVDHLLRGVGGEDRLRHLDRVAAARKVVATEGIGEGFGSFGPEEGRDLAAVGEGGPALRVHPGCPARRGAGR